MSRIYATAQFANGSQADNHRLWVLTRTTNGDKPVFCAELDG